MTNKTFTLLSLGILALLVLTSFASAEITFSNIPTLSQNETSFTINVTSNKTENVSFSATTITDYNGRTINFTSSSASFADNSSMITINYVIQNGFDFFGKTYSTTLTAEGENSENKTQSLSFATTNFCSFESNYFDTLNSKLKVEIRDISVINGFGKDEKWYLFDEVEVGVRVSATDSRMDVNDISLEWGLFDKSSGEWVIEVDEEDEFDLDGGDKETFLIKFKLDDSLDIDLEDLKGANLVFYIRVTGDTDEDSSKTVCNSKDTENDLSLKSESNFVMLDKIQFVNSASCGDKIQMSADVWNIGSRDQEDVYVLIYNKELGINQKVEIGDIDAFDSEKLNAMITIPKSAEEKTYIFTFYVYDEDGDVYETKDDDSSVFYTELKVEGSCLTTPTATISAKLDSEAKAGKDLIVKATIVNTGSETKTFTISLDSYSDWAESATADKTSITLNAGASEDVLITLKVLPDAEGENGFDIEVLEGTKYMFQPVSVTIEKSSFFPSLTGLVSGFGNNAYLYGIGALNLLLIAAIIFVAVKVARRNKQE
jgi:hypothetical protein